MHVSVVISDCTNTLLCGVFFGGIVKNNNNNKTTTKNSIYLLTIILTFVISIVQVPVLYETSIRPRVLAAGLQQDDALKGTRSVTLLANKAASDIFFKTNQGIDVKCQKAHACHTHTHTHTCACMHINALEGMHSDAAGKESYL